jgi:glycosyltransferase involved in cell wall biosynthesis
MGLKQDLGNVIAAAALAESRPDLFWVLMGDGSQRALLERRAARLGNVQILSPCSDEEYPHVLAAADILLVNERASVDDMSLPSKLTSYFASGRPVVAAVPLEGVTAAEINSAGAGLVVPPADPAALLEAVVHLEMNACLADSLAAHGALFAENHLGHERAMLRLDEIVNPLL